MNNLLKYCRGGKERKKIVFNKFISNQMKIRLYFSIFLDIIFWAYVLYVFYEFGSSFKDKWFIEILNKKSYTAIVVLLWVVYPLLSWRYYYFLNKASKKQILPIINSLKSSEQITFGRYLQNSLIIIFKLVIMGGVLKSCCEILLNYLGYDNELLMQSINIAFLFYIIYVGATQIIFFVIELPPILMLVFVATPIIVFYNIGINKGLLGWTFLALIFATILPQFFSVDSLILLPKKLKDYLEKNKDSIKEENLKTKYGILMSIPLFYLALLISELVVYSDQYNYFFNIFTVGHVDFRNVGFFSTYNFWGSITRIFIVSFLLIPYFLVYKDYLLECIANILYRKKYKLENVYNISGKFFKLSLQKEDKKKVWRLDRTEYYGTHNNIFYHYGNCKHNQFELKNNYLKSTLDETIKKIKVFDEDLLLINGCYYVKDDSKISKEVIGNEQFTGYKLLQKLDHSVLVLPVMVLLLIAILFITSISYAPISHRGTYVEFLVNEQTHKFDKFKDDTLKFEKEKILYEKKSYNVDNYRMVILDDGKEVGTFNTSDIIVINYKNSKHYFVKKGSSNYKRFKKSLSN